MRPPRVDYPGARHHVMNRGARQQTVFYDQGLYAYFLGLLRDFPERFGLRVHAYALMPNHFHLLLTSERGDLARGMKHLSSRFTQVVNGRYGWDGPLFRGRYRNRVVGHEVWWRHLFAYVHLNPQRGGLDPEGPYVRTSHDAYIGREPAPRWLDRSALLDSYGSVGNYLAYLEDLGAERIAAPPGFGAVAGWRPHPSGAPETPRAEADPDVRLQMALAEASLVTGESLAALRHVPRGPIGNKAGWLALWWADTHHGVDHGRLCRAFDTSLSEVSRRIKRVEARRSQDLQLGRWMAALETLATPMRAARDPAEDHTVDRVA